MKNEWIESMFSKMEPGSTLKKFRITFDDALEQLEGIKLSLALESKDALELYALQQQVLIGDYYSFDEETIGKFASLLEKEQGKAWKNQRGMKTDVATRKFVRLCNEILEFEGVQESINECLFPELRDNEALDLQALYQQANVGDNKPWNPKYFPTVNSEVWDAWSSKSGMSQRDARDEFMQKARDLSDKYGIKIEALAHIKPSSRGNEFIHRHYHYYLPSDNPPEPEEQEF